MNQQQIPVRPPYPKGNPPRRAAPPRPTAPYWLKVVAVFALCVALVSLALNLGLLYGLSRVQRHAVDGITQVIAVVDELSAQELRYDYRLQQNMPIDVDVPLQKTVQVQINTTVPINTVINVPLTAFGQTVNVQVPVNAQIPINTSVAVEINETFRVSTTVPVNLNVPIVVRLDQPPANEWLARVRGWLEQIRRAMEIE